MSSTRRSLVAALSLALIACDRPAPPTPPPSATTEPKPLPTMSTPIPTTAVRAIEPTEGPATYAVVMLHGVGADADSFLPIARAVAAELPHAVVLVPDGFYAFDGGGSGRQWFSVRDVTAANRPARVKKSAAEVAAWIDGALAARGLAPDRVVILGFSQGAILASYLAVHRDPRPMAVVSLSGRYADDTPAAAATPPVPVLLVHGAADPVIPVSESTDAERALSLRGARVTKHVHPGLAHGVDESVLGEVRAFLRAEIAKP